MNSELSRVERTSEGAGKPRFDKMLFEAARALGRAEGTEQMDQLRFRESVPMPYPALAAILGMSVIAAISVFRFVQAALTLKTNDGSSSGRSIAILIGVTVGASILFSFIPAVAIWAMRHGWKAAPILVTIVGAWAAPQIFAYVDPLSVVSGVAGIVAIVAVWLPSARNYISAVRGT